MITGDPKKYIDGGTDCMADVAQIKAGIARPSLLAESVMRIVADGGSIATPTGMLVGYLRMLQKTLEREFQCNK